ncbi:MAG: N-acetylmuramoyl-L-alanine amidase [Muribaculaceae bacterium]|nr:N-acetylmuramoyl-L-alanine amidase [Muribaculaceae bacterium]
METLKIGSRGEAVKSLQTKLNLAIDGIFGKITDEAVRAFQTAHNLKCDGIVGAMTWAALGASGSVQNRRKITEIIVHCSATAEGKDFTVADIRRWHLQRGFNDVGYHWVIYRDGSVHSGRDEAIIGAHCTGHNSNSIGVCYIGGLASDGKTPKDTRTPEQKTALLKLLKELKQRYPSAVIRSHRDFANKACPSFDATKEYKTI